MLLMISESPEVKRGWWIRIRIKMYWL